MRSNPTKKETEKRFKFLMRYSKQKFYVFADLYSSKN